MSLNKGVKLLGEVFLMAGYLMFLSTFILAVINGGRVVVDVNKYGEMLFECVLLVVGFPLVVFTWIKNLWGDYYGD